MLVICMLPKLIIVIFSQILEPRAGFLKSKSKFLTKITLLGTLVRNSRLRKFYIIINFICFISHIVHTD